MRNNRERAPTNGSLAMPENESGRPRSHGASRRSFLQKMGAMGLASASGALPKLWSAETPNSPMTAPSPPAGTIPVSLRINGTSYPLNLEPRAILLDVLREQLDLPGTKKGCDHGQCGACTILVNGRRIKSCLTLAVMHDCDEITTIEGLEQNEKLHPMQTAFLDCDAFQCGACTSGQIMSAVALLKEPIGQGDGAVREAMSGNICRCGAYKGICEAIQRVRGNASAKAS
ncbi:MAG TPA: (2Fe-2S)-binding protein [Opitutaceae bacterium]|nr:(2Fe-2S)-binding protein [Opitutaceae bacterium]